MSALKLNLTDKAVEHIKKKGGRAALDLVCKSTWSAQFSEVSVDTYIGNRNTRNYHVVEKDGVQLLVSRSLAPYLLQLDVDCKKFLFMSKLTAEMELSNGMMVATI